MINKYTTIKVKSNECSTDAIKRHLKRKGFKYDMWEKGYAIREYFYKDGIQYMLDEFYYDIEKEKVKFKLMITEY